MNEFRKSIRSEGPALLILIVVGLFVWSYFEVAYEAHPPKLEAIEPAQHD